MSKTRVLGIDYDNVSFGEAVNDIFALSSGRDAHIVVTPNAEIGECCFSNAKLREAVKSADYVIADGAGVILASKLCGAPLKERVGGYDTVKALLPLMAQNQKSVYILGAKPGVAEKAAENIKEQYAGIDICGLHDGYFTDDAQIINEINSISPDFLLVALGFPRQEIWMKENRARLSVGVMLGIGGSVDVFAGVAKRAPDFFVRHRLEWFYRLIKQPSRIGRMMKLPKYILRAVFSRIFVGLGRFSDES